MSRTRIIFATGNAGKVREIRDIVGHMGIEVLTMREAGVETDPLEDGSSFEENALIKARSVAALVRKAEEEGRMEGPGLFEMLELLGRDRTVARLVRAASTL